MAVPRYLLVDPDEAGVYHCVTECVRQMFLLGTDVDTRRENLSRWLFCDFLLEKLAGIFCLDVLDYAFLSNHIHTLLRTDPDRAAEASAEDLLWRWLTLHPDRQKGIPVPVTKELVKRRVQDQELVAKARKQLACLSYFQKNLLEAIAKEMNRRDLVRGHFVADRFGSRRVTSEEGVLVASIYVGLNPIRAGLGKSIDSHPFSSYSRRYQGRDGWLAPVTLDPAMETYKAPQECWNAFGAPRNSEKGYLPVTLSQLQDLALWTFDHLRPRKNAQGEEEIYLLPEALRVAVESAGIEPTLWLEVIRAYDKKFWFVLGNAESIAAAASATGRQFYKGQRLCAALFPRRQPDDGDEAEAPAAGTDNVAD